MPTNFPTGLFQSEAEKCFGFCILINPCLDHFFGKLKAVVYIQVEIARLMVWAGTSGNGSKNPQATVLSCRAQPSSLCFTDWLKLIGHTVFRLQSWAPHLSFSAWLRTSALQLGCKAWLRIMAPQLGSRAWLLSLASERVSSAWLRPSALQLCSRA
jgi:hypothetical protein